MNEMNRVDNLDKRVLDQKIVDQKISQAKVQDNMKDSMKDNVKDKVRIAGLGGALPKKRLDNNHYVQYLETSDEWIKVRTGIEFRHIAEDETLTDLATEAAKEALHTSGKVPHDIDVLIVATTTPDNTFPSCASRVHGRLDMRKKNMLAFDVGAACNGFIYALSLARLYFKDPEINNIMIIGADIMSHITDQNDRSTAILFADGAGAVILERTDEDVGFLGCDINTDGSGYELLYVDGGPRDSYSNCSSNCVNVRENTEEAKITEDKKNEGKIKMDGSSIFKLAIVSMAESIVQSVEQAGLTLDEVDLIISHQANVRIIDAIADRLGLPKDKAVRTVSMHGNTSAASIPLALYQAKKDGLLEGKRNIVFCGFGAGLTWGSIVMRI